MSDDMPDFLAHGDVPLRPLSTTDLEWLGARGRSTKRFDDLFDRAARLRLLALADCLPDDPDLRTGAERTEVTALLDLAVEPALSARNRDDKRNLFASVCENREDNLSAMLIASLEVDATRLATGSTRQLSPGGCPATGGYERFIASPEWRTSPARLLELAMSERRCRICDRGEPEVGVEVHHRTYVRLGRERASDLCTLCRECHGIATAELRRRRFVARAVPTPPDTPRETPTVALRDVANLYAEVSHG